MKSFLGTCDALVVAGASRWALLQGAYLVGHRGGAERVDVVHVLGQTEILERTESLALVGQVDNVVSCGQGHDGTMQTNGDDDAGAVQSLQPRLVKEFPGGDPARRGCVIVGPHSTLHQSVDGAYEPGQLCDGLVRMSA